MNDSNEVLKRNVMLLAQGYWNSWYGNAEAGAVSRMLAVADRDTTVDILAALFSQIRVWGLDALRMECCRYAQIVDEPIMGGEPDERASLSLADICNACFCGTMSSREARTAVDAFVASRPRSDVTAAVEGLLLDLKAKGRDALRRSCYINHGEGRPK
ncbi:hypothetical protein [Burkholderia ubonensis]|uniref:hypothetical protein n=1 Tax=Burkholderia ubonensis TaxID=101571 RepID=UPI0007587729|nr:hypothetical protein [Burkholderia ubonensis]KWB69363.1 hypothetical protein WL39_07170 [Burkholderia ubonensis]KWB71860.1 hypothetical protein WL38_05220 [Burkholderia ubonensis]